MGILNWSINSYGDDVNRNVTGSKVLGSGAFTVGSSAANVTNAMTGAGTLFGGYAKADMWVAFNGEASPSNGHFIAANTYRFIEITPGTEGFVSAVLA